MPKKHTFSRFGDFFPLSYIHYPWALREMRDSKKGTVQEKQINSGLSLDDSFLTSIPLLLTKLRPDNLCLFSHVSHTCQISSTYVEAQYYDLADAYQCC